MMILSGLLGANKQWTKEQANDWQTKQPWVVGCNFLPSTAINQLEMWQEESFDVRTIDRELGWAQSIGMNSVRVYLHDLAYETDPKGFKQRMDKFLQIADRHKIRPLFVFFDDCWNPHPQLGKQPIPKKGVHNSGWVRSPGDAQRNWPKDMERLETYVKDILNTFKRDRRVYLWDLYNEPGNSGYELKSMELLKKCFEWAWDVRPSQPVSAGLWYGNNEFNQFQIANSDVITFHNYNDAKNLQSEISRLVKLGRPVVCTEWMARQNSSWIKTNLPVFHESKIACFNWGLVSGKSNTIFPWGSKEGSEEPTPWFHDIFRQDGTPFDATETDLFKKLTARGK
ncbi:MAG: cellulase family glycosylhydrolase [Armatimonadota bacterium]